MLQELLNDFLILIFFMSLLNSIRHGYYLIQAWISSTEEQVIKYRLDNKSLWVLSFSLAYIFTTILNMIV